MVIISAAFERHGLPIPWHYWRVRDMRTLQCLAQATGCSPARQTLKHHSLEDACYQAQVVAEIWQRHSDAFIEHC
ncbi:3'-5' exonuclease [Sodalis glossinidius]|uniref:3'-5' exonuclease n=1 Tax=Sodalis glossinidius TaxID=63612 RepID=UPI0002EA2588|nr:3'-5' exonuclease [Sodalis glossinidius]